MWKKKRKNKPNAPKTRKELRKEARMSKKSRRHEYYTNKRKPGQFVRINNENDGEDINKLEKQFTKEKQVSQTKKLEQDKMNVKKLKNKLQQKINKQVELEKIREKEKKQQIKLKQEMNKQRRKQLIKANLEEDRNIKRLEKQLKLNKRKSKSVPKSFAMDGLDYLLEVCDSETMKSSAFVEQQLAETNSGFEEDLVLMTRNTDDESDSNDEDIENEEMDNSDEDVGVDVVKNKEDGSDKSVETSSEEDQDSDLTDEEDIKFLEAKKRKSTLDRTDYKRQRKISDNSNLNEDGFCENDNESELEDENTDDKKINIEKNLDGIWEDIYGRLRDKDGNVITHNEGKYIPPAVRAQMEANSEDQNRNKKLERLKKQLKGLLNRLAESNMHNIATQVEELFMSNSRNNMNSTISSLVLEALVSNVLAPERLLMEHIMLLIILHANVGTEVGAHFLQTVIKQFDNEFKNKNINCKKLDNLVIILAQLYNFKLFDAKLMFEIINKFAQSFEEKDIECILHILRNVGFNLRKDDPLMLKNLILNLQKRASSASNEIKDNSRVKFMLDILMAIKNNNVSKIPNYDTTYSEHLKKIMKGFIRKGNYVTQLNISLDDLLKAEEQGKWWIVGSAWTGHSVDKNKNGDTEKVKDFSQNLLELARKQRMNTDTRKNIFCIIMSAEDYLDAFEKLLRLALKNQQEREIIHVLLHCCLQEKKYNPYYAVLAQKFCEHDRKYQMTIKYSIWDKLKALNDHSATQISNLAKLLSHLFIEKGLPISVLKVVQFSDLDKVTLRFIRQILLKILLHEDVEICKGVFEKVCYSDKLKMFRESLRLFVHHFLLRNLKTQNVATEKADFLQIRFKLVEKLLTGKESKF